MFKKQIHELQILADYINENPKQIQATGGNISVKFDNKTMRIKASGKKITDINKSDGFIDVDYQSIIKSLQNYNTLNANDLNNNKLNPKISIEVHFHAILKKVVLHTHPVELNSIMASKDASIIIKEIDSSINYIPYVKPGVKLGLEVLKTLKSQKNKTDDCLIFCLQNHGLIITANTAEKVVKQSQKLEKLISNFFNQKKIKFDLEKIYYLLDVKEKLFLSENKFLSKTLKNHSYLINYLATSPDTVIFCGPKPFNINPNQIEQEINEYIELFQTKPKLYVYGSKIYFLAHSKRQADMMEEVFISHIFVIIHCPQNINFLSIPQILDLLQRDDEKYRLKLTK